MTSDKTAPKRLTIDLPPDLHRELKVIAATRGVPMRALIETWIRAAITEDMNQRSSNT